MKTLVLDNYDSFTYNLVHILRDLGCHPDVVRNDKISLEAVDQYDKILLSPGPGLPKEAGVMPALLQAYGPSKSILGVCLGHQAIAEAFGAKLFNLSDVLHGVTSTALIEAGNDRLFNGLPERFRVTHYHSWAVVPESIGDDLRVLSRNEDGIIMAIAHRTFDIKGVQFHPESIMTEHGVRMIRNWMER